jgi:hypothetical protein
MESLLGGEYNSLLDVAISINPSLFKSPTPIPP